MKKSFIVGFGLALVFFIVGFLTAYTREIGLISVGIALVFVAIGGLVSGAFVSGDQNRLNYHLETKEDRQKNRRVLYNSAIIAVPLFIAGGILLSI